MKKQYLIFDMDWTLVHSMDDTTKIIYEYIRNIDEDLIDKSKYIFETTFWFPLIKQVEMIFWNFYDIEKITNEIYDAISDVKIEFFPWVIEKINELSKNYTLFLTTWNTTSTAIKHLEEASLKDKFDMILWSDKLLKWREHLEKFIAYSCDENFCKKAIYTGDWDWDKLFAWEFGIDFIRIWKFWKDKYEINSVAEIDEILKILK